MWELRPAVKGCSTLYTLCRKKAWWDQCCRLWGWFWGPTAGESWCESPLGALEVWTEISSYAPFMRHFTLFKPFQARKDKLIHIGRKWNYLKLLSGFLALTSRRSNIFSLGSTINDLSSWREVLLLSGVGYQCEASAEETMRKQSAHRWVGLLGRCDPPSALPKSCRSLQGSNQSLQAGKILQHAIPAPDYC